MTTAEARKQIHKLLDANDPALSPTAYYALFHPLARAALEAQIDKRGAAVAFAGRFQTGLDLFRPLVTLYGPSPESAAHLLGKLLVAGRPYIFFAPLSQLAHVGGSLHIENQVIYRIYTLDSRHFSPEMNVMVQPNTGPNGLPRCEFKRDGEVVSVAGVNWQGPAFAELYVRTEANARRQGWGRAVLTCLAGRLLKGGVRPIYLVENNNEASRRLAEKVGFVDTGSRQVYADAVYTGNPLDKD